MNRGLLALLVLALAAAVLVFERGLEKGPAAPEASEAIPAPKVADLPRVDGAVEPGRIEMPAVQADSGKNVAGAKPLRLEGEVLDPSGAPVAGAAVRALRSGAEGFALLDAATNLRARSVAESASDAAGAFALALADLRPVLLAVDATGYPPVRLPLRRAGEFVSVKLEAGATLHGRVRVAGTAQPIAGVRLQARRPWRDDGIADRSVIVETVTDANGGYRLEGLPGGDVEVDAMHEHFVSSRPFEVAVPAGVAVEHDFELEDGERVDGRVIDAATRQPIAGAQVRGYRSRVETDAAGRFAIDAIARTEVDLTIAKPGYGDGRAILRQRFGDPVATGLEIALEAAHAARGALLDSAGGAVAEAYVAAVAIDESGRFMDVDWNSSRSRADGTFAIEGLRADLRHVLFARAEGFGTLCYDFPPDEPRAPGGVVELGTIVLRPGIALTVHAVDERGRGLEGREVVLRGCNSDRGRFDPAGSGGVSPSVDLYVASRSSRTGLDGVARFDDCAPGRYVAASRIAGSHDSVETEVAIADGGAPEATLVLPIGLRLAGRVRAGDGGALPKVYVSIDPEGGQTTTGDAECDAGGAFAASGLAAGPYSLTAYPYATDADRRAGREFAVAIVHGVAAGASEAEIVLQRSLALRGRVVDAAGAAVASVLVSAKVGGDVLDGTTTDAAGRFALRVRDGASVDLEVTDESRVLALRTGVAPAAGEIEIQVTR